MERPEHRLLLACARVCSDSERKDLILSCLAEHIDWDYLITAAGQHNIASLLYWHLNATCRESVPAAILERLHDHFIRSAGSNLRLTAELLGILELFNNSGIKAIPFKGPVLALTLYENPDLREFVDLDILVQKQEVFKALKLLRELGYRKIPDYSHAQESEILDREYHYCLEKENGLGFIELHWNVLARHFVLPLSIDGWWERAGCVPIHSRDVPNLSAEDLLVALCAHGCKHMWHSLSWIIDITKLLEHNPDLNWQRILSEYNSKDLQRIIFLGLDAADIVLDARIPKEILIKARADVVAIQLARQVKAQLFQHHGEQGGLRFIRFQSKLKSRWIDKLRFCFRVISTPSLTEGHFALHRLLSPMYLFRRLIKR